MGSMPTFARRCPPAFTFHIIHPYYKNLSSHPTCLTDFDNIILYVPRPSHNEIGKPRIICHNIIQPTFAARSSSKGDVNIERKIWKLNTPHVAISLFSKCSLLLVRHPPVGQGQLIHEVSRSHTTTRHSR